ncbi:MAG: hypothetical protein CMF69_11580 [Magnetovibrio sp.]|nr:hypothetical protein [Magnetovibrio sp.]
MTSILQKISLLQCKKETPAQSPFNFANLFLKSPKGEIANLVWHLILSVDFSGSMGATSSDGLSSLEHAKNVILNILRFVDRLDVTVYITIRMFDNDGLVICEKLCVDAAAIQTIQDELKNVFPRGSTNIKSAVEYVNTVLMEHAPADVQRRGPHVRNTHILLTDGCPYGDETFRVGERVRANGGSPHAIAVAMANYIHTSMPTGIENYFIGLGAQVNSMLLNHLVSLPGGCGYHFVNNAELAGLVYAEILYDIFYSCAKEIVVKCEGGLLYDYLTNTWVPELNIGNLSCDKEKSVNVQIQWDSEQDINISCTYKLNDEQKTETLVCSDYSKDETTTVDTRDITVWPWLWRQRTMSLMHKANNLAGGDKSIITAALNVLKDKISLWMTTHQLGDDPFMLRLCDDINNTIYELDIPMAAAAVYRSARMHSQGQQRAFAPPAATGPATVPPRPSGFGRGSSAPQHAVYRTLAVAAAAPAAAGVAPMTPPRRPPPIGAAGAGRGISGYANPTQVSWMRQVTQ